MIQTQITPKHWLDAPAAASYARMRAAGCPEGITEAGRTFEQQTAMFAAFLAGRLAATAAVPGTSKHEKGNALDLPEPARAWVRENGLAFGWIKDRVAREPWHMEYQIARDQHLADAPTPLDLHRLQRRARNPCGRRAGAAGLARSHTRGRARRARVVTPNRLGISPRTAGAVLRTR